MDENYFDGPGEQAPTGDEHETQGDEQGSQDTFLVAKESFPNAMPGDEIHGRVVRVLEKEIEVEPMEKDEMSGEHQEGEPAMAEQQGGGEPDMMS